MYSSKETISHIPSRLTGVLSSSSVISIWVGSSITGGVNSLGKSNVNKIIIIRYVGCYRCCLKTFNEKILANLYLSYLKIIIKI